MRPEMKVRKLAHRLGYRFRLHVSGLPGKPDLTFPGRRKVIFVNGCFWHQHQDPACKITRLPKSNLEYWKPKLARNVEKDVANVAALRESGWEVLTIWECEAAADEALEHRLQAFLG